MQGSNSLDLFRYDAVWRRRPRKIFRLENKWGCPIERTGWSLQYLTSLVYQRPLSGEKRPSLPHAVMYGKMKNPKKKELMIIF